LVERITAADPNAMAMEDSWAVQLRPDHLPIATAIRDIVLGSLRSGRSATLSYQIAAQIIAEYLGTRVDDDAIAERSEALQAAIDDAIAELLGEYGEPDSVWPRLADVLSRGPALDIPWVQESLPNGTGLMTEQEVERAASTIARIGSSDEDDSARALALTYGSWIIQASKQRLALLLACD
jgi:hypothetical protein